jgi:hypothetical protein
MILFQNDAPTWGFSFRLGYSAMRRVGVVQFAQHLHPLLLLPLGRQLHSPPIDVTHLARTILIDLTADMY